LLLEKQGGLNTAQQGRGDLRFRPNSFRVQALILTGIGYIALAAGMFWLLAFNTVRTT
jgi:hypothetical protein